MADLQVGNQAGIAAVGVGDRHLAAVTADGANYVDVDSIDKLALGMLIDIVAEADGAVLASARTIDALDAVNLRVTYSGADAAATTDHSLVLSGLAYLTDEKTNLNGGGSARSGFFDKDISTIESMRARLKVINATYYTDTVLNSMTTNDMAFAIRTADHAGTIKQ